ncbi:hypothetical protein AXF42_Ash001985 [Apostasia shenzhenica]|uniref:Uncharacterized protein n=1 Tax=Apostasia shenzhenica TaxID=1088818 RepID=A0A2I0ABS3_9ASPA|nr:hypothetical protein AXF42_Ash001985 [Apostasia shenzhenica]
MVEEAREQEPQRPEEGLLLQSEEVLRPVQQAEEVQEKPRPVREDVLHTLAESA